jgi:LysR family nitrogen assimilation transcriptional regulator
MTQAAPALDLRQLRYFLAIVEEGSFSRAAGRLRVAQPALSLHVRRMEELLGTQLLLRGPQGVAATEPGQVLARRAMAMLADLGQTEEEIRSLGREPTGVVRLGLPGTIGAIVTVPLIKLCKDRCPGVKIIVAEAMSGFVRQWLVEGTVDLGILYNDPQGQGLAHRPLLEEELVLICPPGTGGADRPALDLLGSLPLILPSGAHGLRRMLDRVFRDRGMTVDPAFEVDSYASIKQLVEDGFGCSVLPQHAVTAEAGAGRLVLRRFEDAALWRSAHLVHATRLPMTRACGAVHDMLGELVAGLIDGGCWAGARPIVPPPAA